MTNNEAIDVLKNDIEICTIQQKQACDMAIKAIKTLNELESIIVEQLDKSDDQKECMTLRWVLDKIAEVEE